MPDQRLPHRAPHRDPHRAPHQVPRLALLLAAALGLPGCPGFGDQLLSFETVAAAPSWEVEVAPIFRQHCGGCHGDPATNGAPYPLATWAQSVPHLVRIDIRVVQQETMPPGGGLTAEELAVVAAWVAAGGPRTPADAAGGDGGSPLDVGPQPDLGPQPDAGPRPDAGPQPDLGPRPDGGAGPTWTADVGPLMATSCAFNGCHGLGGAQKGLVLATYTGFVNGGVNGVVHGDGDPARSRLVDALRGRNGVALMPPGGSLPEADIARVEAFITAGYPE